MNLANSGSSLDLAPAFCRHISSSRLARSGSAGFGGGALSVKKDIVAMIQQNALIYIVKYLSSRNLRDIIGRVKIPAIGLL